MSPSHVPARRWRAAVARLLVPALALAGCTLALAAPAEKKAPARKGRVPIVSDRWGPWVEPAFPFFSTVLDARKAGRGLPTDNLAPRTLVLQLGGQCWAAFDPDLLRVVAVWRGPGVSDKALAPGSYHDIGRKTPGGQSPLPEPLGTVWLANGIYPGWQTGAALALADPREPAPSPEEVGRGPIPETLGRFQAIRQVRDGAVLEYTAAGAEVREWTTLGGTGDQPVVERHLHVGAATQPLVLAVGTATADTQVALGVGPGSRGAQLERQGALWIVRVAPGMQPAAFAVGIAPAGAALAVVPKPIPTERPARRWPQEMTTRVHPSTSRAAYVVDHIDLPEDNPWRRAVRPGDAAFFHDGTGLLVTLDGDVWRLRGLGEPGGAVRWQRFTSGLHEPMTLALRDEEIYAFDKNGIWRLRDTDGDGEADVHELFSNAFAQTADMREFPSTLRLAPGGEFVIAKGGQQAATLGKHNGSVLRISADGRRSTVLGHGFRQPSIGVNVRTGLVTSSDQQGQYIPSTPLHIVRDRQFYGYLSEKQPREVYPEPIADPLTWIPHAVNSSAMSQVWLFGAKFGPLTDSLVHIAFNKPELFRVLLDERGRRPQASVVSITREFRYTPLNGSVNPADGMLYLAGFQVVGWGNVLDTPAGFGRVRYTGAPVTLPREIVPMDKGVLLRFDVPLDPKKATDPASYSLQSWHYIRTYKYGSAQYKEDGKPGQDALPASSAYLSRDGRSVFVGVPHLKPVMQLRVGWSLATADGVAFEENGYTTPYELPKFDPQAEGFGDIAVDLTPRTAVAQAAAGPVNAEEGRRLAQLFACVACHAEESAGIVKAGPTWRGLYGHERPVVVEGKKAMALADETYLRESILNPTAKIVSGFEKGEYAMPSFAGVLNDSQIESLVLYIKTLR